MKNQVHAFTISFRSALPAVALISCSLAAMTAAKAGDLLGLYIGAAYGQAHVRVEPGQVIPQSTGSLGGLDMTHSAFQGMLGVRLLSFLGAEVAYMDFGKVSGLAGQPIPGIPGATVMA